MQTDESPQVNSLIYVSSSGEELCLHSLLRNKTTQTSFSLTIGQLRLTSCRNPDDRRAVMLLLLRMCRFMSKTVIMSSEELLSVDYEVFGRVQGVFFRKYTQSEGKRLGLVGWVQNTDAGTVQGQLQGPASKVQQMQQWLQTTGSPQSRIAKAEFKNERAIDKLDFKDFKVAR
ncbi:acylphosphatase-1 isoform X1 [Onychostoma macrolepis]|nr:acylphosphatase-1 isoform X1 [Onychostoma macrolepis]